MGIHQLPPTHIQARTCTKTHTHTHAHTRTHTHTHTHTCMHTRMHAYIRTHRTQGCTITCTCSYPVWFLWICSAQHAMGIDQDLISFSWTFKIQSAQGIQHFPLSFIRFHRLVQLTRTHHERASKWPFQCIRFETTTPTFNPQLLICMRISFQLVFPLIISTVRCS